MLLSIHIDYSLATIICSDGTYCMSTLELTDGELIHPHGSCGDGAGDCEGDCPFFVV